MSLVNSSTVGLMLFGQAWLSPHREINLYVPATSPYQRCLNEELHISYLAQTLKVKCTLSGLLSMSEPYFLLLERVMKKI